MEKNNEDIFHVVKGIDPYTGKTVDIETLEKLRLYDPLQPGFELALPSADPVRLLEIKEYMQTHSQYGPWIMPEGWKPRVSNTMNKNALLLDEVGMWIHFPDSYGLEIHQPSPILTNEVAGADLSELVVWERCRNKAGRMIRRLRTSNQFRKSPLYRLPK